MTRANFRRLEADVRRQSLIDATARCLARHGARVSVRMICAEAGVSPGLLRHYFAGIDELVAATYADIGAMMARTMQDAADAAGSDPRARLRAFILASFRAPIVDSELLATWITFWSRIGADPAMQALHRQIYASHRQPVEDLVTDIIGPAGDPLDVQLLAVGLTALVDGLWLELCLDPASFSADDAEAIADRWLETQLPAGGRRR